jgi:hypothetical protein
VVSVEYGELAARLFHHLLPYLFPVLQLEHYRIDVRNLWVSLWYVTLLVALAASYGIILLYRVIEVPEFLSVL